MPMNMSAIPPSAAEVAVVGGGPAGATAARLLAEWGHDVVLLCRSAASIPSLAESIPPSTRKVLAAVNALELVEGAGFLPTSGNTSWWGTEQPRVETFEGGVHGWQVLRADLEALLLRAAAASGVRVEAGAHVRRVRLEGTEGAQVDVESEGTGAASLRARHVLDASGRAGALARQGFRREQGPRTLALSAVWRRAKGFDVPDDSHTLVESFAEGWAFSVPVAPGVRHVAVMVDQPRRSSRPRDVRRLYEQGLRNARCMCALLEGAELVTAPWALDASSYTASIFAGEGFALVGDAGSFLDPLSSFGVKKALASGWLAAVATRTALRDTSRATLAAEFFSRREAQVQARYAHETALHAARAAAGHRGSAFWTVRASASRPPAGDDDDTLASDEAVRIAFEGLKARPALRLRLGAGVRIAPAPRVWGREIAMGDALVGPDGRPIHFVSGVEAATLARLAPGTSEVGQLCEAYERAAPGVAMAVLLHGLSTLLAAGLLDDDSGSYRRPADASR
jgi:flavin-dependent dehydrogenase